MNKKIIIVSVILLCIILGILFSLGLFKKVPKQLSINTQKQTIPSEMLVQLESQFTQAQQEAQKYPEDPQKQRDVGRLSYLMGNTDVSQEYIQKAIALDSTNPQYYVDLGDIFELKGEYDQAEQNYKKAISLNNKKIIPPTILSSPLIDKKTSETTQENNIFVVGMYNIITPYTHLAELYIEKLNLPLDAITVINEGIKVNPKYPDFYLLLSEAYTKLGDTTKASLYKSQFDKLTVK